MAQDLGQDFSTGTLTAFTGLGATLAAGANDDAAEVSFDTANAPLALDIEVIAPMLTGTPDGNKQLVLDFKWGASTGNTTDATNSYHKQTVSVPTASTTFKKTFRVAVQAPFLLLNVLNDQTAGPSLNSTYTVKYLPVYGNQQ